MGKERVFDKTFFAVRGFFDRIEVTSGRKRTGRKRVPPGPHLYFHLCVQVLFFKIPVWVGGLILNSPSVLSGVSIRPRGPRGLRPGSSCSWRSIWGKPSSYLSQRRLRSWLIRVQISQAVRISFSVFIFSPFSVSLRGFSP